MTKTTMKGRTLTLRVGMAALALTVLAGCEWGPRLETRTFRLSHIRSHEAANLIEPYVFDDRERNPGAMSGIEGALTVRETPDNLDRIERVLAEFDLPQSEIRLHFQLIEADGFTESDPRISAVEDELRSLFQFRGYRLAGETTLMASDATEITQRFRADDRSSVTSADASSDQLYTITGSVYRAGSGLTRLDEISLWTDGGKPFATTVNIRTGQTIVLGSAPKTGSSATLFLTVRAEEVPGPS